MQIQEQWISLKDGRRLLLRSLQPEDAGALCDHQYQASGETYYMSRYQEEGKLDPERMRGHLEQLLRDDRALSVAAVDEGRIIGSAEITKVMDHMKFRHRGDLGISIREIYWGLGIGRQMISLLLHEARRNGFEQVELGVFSDNERAICLYESCGFLRTGQVPRAFKLKDGSYRDEILMVCML